MSAPIGDAQILARRCAWGADDRGYCPNPASEHLATVNLGHPGDGNTMACSEHCAWFATRRHLVRDRHPIGSACGMPGTSWVDSAHGMTGWCWVDPDDEPIEVTS